MILIIKSLLNDPFRIFRGLGYRVLDCFAKFLSDKVYLKTKWFIRTGHPLDLDNPKTFNEKLQWLKLYDRKPIYTTMVDKYRAKDFVASIIGNEHIIPTFAIYKDVDEINLDVLPRQFVLKCTHDSGGVFICKDKECFNRKDTFLNLKIGLKRNFYLYNREWPYKDVPPRIIAEKYMINDNTDEVLNDYKFFCFNGAVKFFKIDFDRFSDHHANYYSPNGELLPFGEAKFSPVPSKNVTIPSTLKEMISYAEMLSKGIPFLRVDFYDINGKVYFGELTFFPDSGYGKWTDERYDKIIGNYISLH